MKKFIVSKYAAASAAAVSCFAFCQAAMAQSLGTAVTDATTAMSTDAAAWIPGIMGIIALGVLVSLGIAWLGKTKRG